MLVAAKVDSEHPWRARRSSTSTRCFAQLLRNHEFNMWFTIAVERDSRLGLAGTLEVLQELTGAVSIRELPTLKLFKIAWTSRWRATRRRSRARGRRPRRRRSAKCPTRSWTSP